MPFPTGRERRGDGRVDDRRLGYPDRAQPCSGHRQVVDRDTCIWCGHLPAELIDVTWKARARATRELVAA